MLDVTFPDQLPPSHVTDPLLAELQATLDGEIPLCAHMGIRIRSYDEHGLALAAPLALNKNHQRTAFAGSLNALCTVAGWGSVFLLTRTHDLPCDIVIRRSGIKYLKPINCAELVAVCSPVSRVEREHFVEMLKEKGQAKLDLRAEIRVEAETAVSFHGSYVASGRVGQGG